VSSYSKSLAKNSALNDYKRYLPKNPVSYSEEQLGFLKDFKADLRNYFAMNEPNFDKT
jgi:hypothetical protein